jgi:hypothetical protein
MKSEFTLDFHVMKEV